MSTRAAATHEQPAEEPAAQSTTRYPPIALRQDWLGAAETTRERSTSSSPGTRMRLARPLFHGTSRPHPPFTCCRIVRDSRGVP